MFLLVAFLNAFLCLCIHMRVCIILPHLCVSTNNLPNVWQVFRLCVDRALLYVAFSNICFFYPCVFDIDL